MKTSELRQIIKEEINKVLNEPIYDPKNTSPESIFKNFIKGPKNKENEQGMAEGFWIDKSGKMTSLSMYKNGEEDGPKEVYKDNELYARGMMKDDRPVGTWQEFSNGKFDEFAEWGQ
jgi:antitoxin component YwqK of YwqJK toxin-antitoxin module